MSVSLDRVLRLAATGSEEKVIDLCREIGYQIDEAERTGAKYVAFRWREVSRVIDGMAALRFDNWGRRSPAKKRDLESLAS